MEIDIMPTPSIQRFYKGLATTAALGGVLLLAGCAGDPPTAQLAVSNQAVIAAETAGAVEFAPVEMRKARDKLNSAEKAEHDRDYKEAKRLAEQAEWDARVAERRAQAGKAQRALQDAQRGVQELREEGMRNVN